MKYRKRLMFNPDVELDEEQICIIENKILDEIDEKLGNKYQLYDWKLEFVCTILATKE